MSSKGNHVVKGSQLAPKTPSKPGDHPTGLDSSSFAMGTFATTELSSRRASPTAEAYSHTDRLAAATRRKSKQMGLAQEEATQLDDYP